MPLYGCCRAEHETGADPASPPPRRPSTRGGGCGHGRGLPSVKTRFKYVSAEREPQEVLADVYKKAAARAGRKGDRSEEERGGGIMDL